MKNLLVLMFMWMVSFCLVYPAQEQQLENHEMISIATRICRPRAGEKLFNGQKYQIQWCQDIVMSGNIEIFLYKETSSYPVYSKVVDNTGIYMWTVPKVPDGNYKIKIGVSESGVFEIIGYELQVWEFEYRRRFEQFKEGFLWLPRSRPDLRCPMCGTLDIGKLLDTVSPIAGKKVQLAIYRGGKLVTKLGIFGEKHRLPREVNVKFSKADYKAMKQGGNIFELRVTNMKGKILYSRKISIKMGKRKR